MKETQQHNPDQVQDVRQKEVKKQLAFIGRKVPGDGHKCYELNLETLIMSEIEPIKTDANFNEAKKGKLSGSRKINIKENCIYVTALNEKNAIKKFNKRVPGALVKL